MRRLKADEIECRLAQVNSTGFSLLLYKTARVDRAILDELYPNRWQNDFKVIDGKMYGGIGVYDKELKEWLWRWDCGTESNIEAEKGQASDCFKRAGFKWGIGVELYTAPFIWVSGETAEDEYASKKTGKKIYKLADKFRKFEVAYIDYADNGDISQLVILDNKGKEVYRMKTKENSKQQKKQDDTDIYITLSKIDDIESVKSYYELNKEEVKDRKIFHKMAQDRINQIKRHFLEQEVEPNPNPIIEEGEII